MVDLPLLFSFGYMHEKTDQVMCLAFKLGNYPLRHSQSTKIPNPCFLFHSTPTASLEGDSADSTASLAILTLAKS
ncbi:hypothetical protein SOVF_065830, partial [Spinacia oleracea]